mmetsp:Transcript_99465/g.310567  ORF Transcript_99465/g.310567 Transcript_99465/m.310567 type:complete len:235 (+) Transcript_99465:1528-2232(+)
MGPLRDHLCSGELHIEVPDQLQRAKHLLVQPVLHLCEEDVAQALEGDRVQQVAFGPQIWVDAVHRDEGGVQERQQPGLVNGLDLRHLGGQFVSADIASALYVDISERLPEDGKLGAIQRGFGPFPRCCLHPRCRRWHTGIRRQACRVGGSLLAGRNRFNLLRGFDDEGLRVDLEDLRLHARRRGHGRSHGLRLRLDGSGELLPQLLVVYAEGVALLDHRCMLQLVLRAEPLAEA